MRQESDSSASGACRKGGRSVSEAGWERARTVQEAHQECARSMPEGASSRQGASQARSALGASWDCDSCIWARQEWPELCQETARSAPGVGQEHA